jgi:hypothetical protein
MAGSDFSCPCIIGDGSSPSQSGSAREGRSGQTRERRSGQTREHPFMPLRKSTGFVATNTRTGPGGISRPLMRWTAKPLAGPPRRLAARHRPAPHRDGSDHELWLESERPVRPRWAALIPSTPPAQTRAVRRPVSRSDPLRQPRSSSKDAAERGHGVALRRQSPHPVRLPRQRSAPSAPRSTVGDGARP